MTDRGEEAQSRRFRPYPEYKDSGIEWLGEIPAHWEVNRQCLTVTGCQNGVWGEEPDGQCDMICVRVADFDRIEFRVCLDNPTLRSIDPSTAETRRLENEDLLLEKSGGGERQPVGAVVIYDYDEPAVCSNFVGRMTVADGYHPRFLTYLHAALYAACINTRSIKQSTGIQNLDSASYLNERVGLPNEQEQRAIADFLDRETAEIDSLIAKKERLIELLQEKRTALITRAVTRGLDPKVPMKDSGIEWLGETPTHWELKPLKRLLRRSDYGISESLRVGGDIRVLTMAHIQDGEIVLPQDGSISGIDRTMVLESGDLLFNRTNSRELVGKVGIFRGDHDDWVTFASYLVRLTPHQHVEPEWLNYLLNSTGVLGMARSMALLSVNQANLNPTKHQQIIVPVPALSEQRSIAAFLSRETAKIDSLIVKIRQAINYLHEFRTAIISSAVTGKIDSREEAS